MDDLTLNCPNCGEVSKDVVLFLCNRCKQEEMIFENGTYICPACFLPGQNFQCMNCGSTEVTLKTSARTGVITPVFMLAVLAIIVVGITGFIFISRTRTDTSFEPKAQSLCNSSEKTDAVCKGKVLNSSCGAGLYCRNSDVSAVEDSGENFNCTCSK